MITFTIYLDNITEQNNPPPPSVLSLFCSISIHSKEIATRKCVRETRENREANEQGRIEWNEKKVLQIDRNARSMFDVNNIQAGLSAICDRHLQQRPFLER